MDFNDGGIWLRLDEAMKSTGCEDDYFRTIYSCVFEINQNLHMAFGGKEYCKSGLGRSILRNPQI